MTQHATIFNCPNCASPTQSPPMRLGTVHYFDDRDLLGCVHCDSSWDVELFNERFVGLDTVNNEQKIMVELTDDQIAYLRGRLDKFHTGGIIHPPVPQMAPPHGTHHNALMYGKKCNELRGIIDDLIFHIERSPCTCDACQEQYNGDSERLIKEIREKLNA